MTLRSSRLSLAITLLLASCGANSGQGDPSTPAPRYSNDAGIQDSLRTCAPVTVTMLTRNEAGVAASLVAPLEAEFAQVYPKIACFLRDGLAPYPDVVTTVRTFTPQDPGVANACCGRVDISAAYLTQSGGDPGLLTHELTHLVQNYPAGVTEWWWTEGIADAVRYLYTPANAGWAIPAPDPAASYRDGYRVTAGFLLWLERTRRPGLIRALDEVLRRGGNPGPFWVTTFGVSVDDLWAAYLDQ